MLAMKNIRLLAFLFPLALLLGYSLPTTPASQTGASGNWQIQAGTALTSPPTAPYLLGAIQESGSTLTGTFATAQSSAAGPVVESYSGTYTISTGSLVLSSTLPLPDGQTIATLAVPADPTALSTGTLAFQCGVCNNGQLFPVVAAEIAPLNGTYTGNLSGTLTTTSPRPESPVAAPRSILI